MITYSINVRGRLFDLSEPQVMGILNVTPDSFYADSRMQTVEAITQRVEQILSEGATMIDVGACSTRPGSSPATAAEEMERLRIALPIVRQMAPDIPLSIDTFRSEVARMAVEQLGADIINDVTGGEADPQMFQTVAQLSVPYVLTHGGETTDLMHDILLYFSRRIQELRDLGQKDIILDPGYGFGKTIEQNYQLLHHQDELLIFELPLLVGVSRKSMIYRQLSCTSDKALNGTTVLNTLALMKGASILRVHDVRECKETIQLYQVVSPT